MRGRALLQNGAGWFLLATCGATWLVAWAVQGWWALPQLSPAGRLLAHSTLYLVISGWQPLVAVLLVRAFVEAPASLDAGFRATPPGFLRKALLCSALLLVSSAALAIWLGSEWMSSAEHTAPGFTRALVAIGCVALASVLIYLQSLVEEVSWRGYFLVRVMERVGAWPGLVTHGAVWGLWYAPLVVLSLGTDAASLAQAVALSISCVFLGVVLGWLRLASRSIWPAVAANALITLGAGLPLMLGGEDVGARGAVFSPLGWLPLSLMALWLGLSPLRRAVVTPSALAVFEGAARPFPHAARR